MIPHLGASCGNYLAGGVLGVLYPFGLYPTVQRLDILLAPANLHTEFFGARILCTPGSHARDGLERSVRRDRAFEPDGGMLSDGSRGRPAD